MSAGNGATPPIEPAVARAIHDYQGLARHLGAALVILSAMPLESMLAANRTMRPRVLLTLPPGTSPQQAGLVQARLDNDERLLVQAIKLANLFDETD
jgi:hypothetical protein